MTKTASQELRDIKVGSEKAKRKVQRLTRAYNKAQEELDNYQEEYEDILAEFEKLAIERNIALDKLKRGCKEARISSGPFEIVTQRNRVFDGNYLYDSIEDDEIRDAVVQIQYKVQPAMFDKFVQAGGIDAKTAQKSISEIKEIVKALNSPPEIVMG
jgi:chromosome segregation ATPase